MYDISTLRSFAVSEVLISEYRSARRCHTAAIWSRISSSEAPPRTSDFRSWPDCANRHVKSAPSVDSRIRVQLPQKACVTDEMRSEEHTSELQSLAYLVCRLLLEKKKKKKIIVVCHVIASAARRQRLCK